jgi:hypothetical protein
MRISPFVAVFDELSYYVYHRTVYDSGFRFMAEFCWNITNMKWVPSFFEDTYTKLNNYLTPIDIEDPNNITPKNLRIYGENLFFLNNVQQFLIVTVAFSTIIFIALKILRKYLPLNLARLLRPFCSYSYLIASLLGDNIQYLSFRAFERLLYAVPTDGIAGYCDLIMAVIVLFFAVAAACSMYLMIWSFSRHAFHSDLYCQALTSYVVMTIATIGRCFNGFCHAYITDSPTQLCLLLLVNAVNLMLVKRTASLFLFRRNTLIFTLMLIGKLLLGFCLLL